MTAALLLSCAFSYAAVVLRSALSVLRIVKCCRTVLFMLLSATAARPLPLQAQKVLLILL